MPRLPTHALAIFCLLLVTLLAAGSAPASEPPELSAELQPLNYRLGTWTAVVEWLGEDGSVARVMPSVLRVTPALGGHALESKGRLVGTSTEVLAIIFNDQETGRVTEVGVSASGRLDTLHATFEDDRVVFTAEPRGHGDERVIFRAIDSGFEDDRYDTTGWVSTDGGETWRQTFRQTNHRLEPL